ncbi:MAG: hypothetical protein WCA81_11350 [Rhizomicrobium sp.]
MSGGTQSTQTQTNTVNPAQMAQDQQNSQATLAAANTPFTPYTGQQVAPFSATQVAGQQGLLNLAGSNVGGSTLNNAISGVQGILGYTPQSITAPTIGMPGAVTPQTVSPTPVTARQLSSTDLSPYLNPYTNDVTNATMAQLKQANDLAQTGNSEGATTAGAFGGNRTGVADALTNDAYLKDAGSTLAGLNQANYSNAQQAALQDIQNKMGVGEFNANAGLNAGEFNANAGLNAGEYNTSAGQAAQQYNANANLTAQQQNAANALQGQNLQLNTGASLANMSNEQLTQALQNAGIIEGVGQEQTAQQQAQDSAAYNEFLRQLQYPQVQAQLRAQAQGLIPLQQTITSTGNNSISGGTAGNVLQGLGILAQSYGSLSNGGG